MLVLRCDIEIDFPTPKQITLLPFPHLTRLSLYYTGDFFQSFLRCLHKSPIEELELNVSWLGEAEETFLHRFTPNLRRIIKAEEREVHSSISHLHLLVQNSPAYNGPSTLKSMDIWDVDEELAAEALEEGINEDPVNVELHALDRFIELRELLEFGTRLANLQGLGLDGRDIMAALDNLKGLKYIYDE